AHRLRALGGLCRRRRRLPGAVRWPRDPGHGRVPALHRIRRHGGDGRPRLDLRQRRRRRRAHGASATAYGVSRLRPNRPRHDHDPVHDLPARRHRAGPRRADRAQAAMTLLVTEKLAMEFGGVAALDGVSLAVAPGEILAIIGPNGAGKTTLFNLLCGLLMPRRGRVMLDGEDVTGQAPHRLARLGLSRTFQNLNVFLRTSAGENVIVGRHLPEHRNVLAHLLALQAVRRQNGETRRRAEALLAQVGLHKLADRPAGTLAYGALKRLEIARALATEPKILLLDEPAAGCNPVETSEIDGIIRDIARTGVAARLVEHAMRLVMHVAGGIHVLANGRTLAEGTAAEVRADPAVIEAYLGVRRAQEATSAVG